MFFEVIRSQNYYFLIDRRLKFIFFKCIGNMKLCYESHYSNFDFKLTSDAKI